MPYTIKNKLILANGVKRVDIHAPVIAKKVKPGQFVSLSPEKGMETVPLTVIDTDLKKGTISLIFQESLPTTIRLGELGIQDAVYSLLGPLGEPATIGKFGTVLCVATGIGAAQILPVCRALREAGNKVIGIIGAKTKRLVLLEAQMRLACNKILIATEDGTYERKGKATDLADETMQSSDVNLVYAIGSVKMMEDICGKTKSKRLKTLVQISPKMFDCVGICGACRVKIGGKTILACIEGPEFDGHKVDFDDLKVRMNAYKGISQWGNQRSTSKTPKNEQGILTKFLSGIVKN